MVVPAPRAAEPESVDIRGAVTIRIAGQRQRGIAQFGTGRANADTSGNSPSGVRDSSVRIVRMRHELGLLRHPARRPRRSARHAGFWFDNLRHGPTICRTISDQKRRSTRQNVRKSTPELSCVREQLLDNFASTSRARIFFEQGAIDEQARLGEGPALLIRDCESAISPSGVL